MKQRNYSERNKKIFSFISLSLILFTAFTKIDWKLQKYKIYFLYLIQLQFSFHWKVTVKRTLSIIPIWSTQEKRIILREKEIKLKFSIFDLVVFLKIFSSLFTIFKRYLCTCLVVGLVFIGHKELIIWKIRKKVGKLTDLKEGIMIYR